MTQISQRAITDKEWQEILDTNLADVAERDQKVYMLRYKKRIDNAQKKSFIEGDSFYKRNWQAGFTISKIKGNKVTLSFFPNMRKTTASIEEVEALIHDSIYQNAIYVMPKVVYCENCNDVFQIKKATYNCKNERIYAKCSRCRRNIYIKHEELKKR